MGLVKEYPVHVFDVSQIKTGYLVYGKHSTWDKGKAGFATAVTEKELVVQYHPGIGNVTNHFYIPIAEAVAGKWEIRYSADMSEIGEYGIKVDDAETEEEDESGSIDL